MKDHSLLDYLITAIHHYNLKVVAQYERMIRLEHNYTIEVEAADLYKLLHEGQVIAPFADVKELCNFILMDMKLNEKD